MSRSRDRGDAPLLFDLPLNDPAGKNSRPSEQAHGENGLEPRPEPEADTDDEPNLPLFPTSDLAAADQSSGVEAPEAQPVAEGAPRSAPLGKRLLAAAIDLVVWLAALLLLALGATLMGVAPGRRDWPAALLFLAAFSFLYTVIPLAFWGKTPGMAWARIVARSGDGEPLTFGQTGSRWLACLLTIALLGLPALLALLPGGSLVDRLSHSHTDEE
ncbi:MAG TPA: RDD family protein [Thermoanaerobaculia bacterium]|nr:RDD family protein [Thermoanaerobaculia bacterium]